MMINVSYRWNRGSLVVDYPDLPHIEVTNRGGDCEVRRKRVVPCRPKRRLDLQKTTTDIFQNILFEKAKYMAWQHRHPLLGERSFWAESSRQSNLTGNPSYLISIQALGLFTLDDFLIAASSCPIVVLNKAKVNIVSTSGILLSTATSFQSH